MGVSRAVAASVILCGAMLILFSYAAVHHSASPFRLATNMAPGQTFSMNNPNHNSASDLQINSNVSITDLPLALLADARRLLTQAESTIIDLQRQLAAKGSGVAANASSALSSNAYADDLNLYKPSRLKVGMVLIAALATAREAKLALHNMNTHFDGWDCIAFVFVSPEHLPEWQLEQLGLVCTIQRLQGLSWGVWLKSIPAVLLRQYEYVAILVQDLFIPPETSIPRLVSLAQKHKAAVISPAIMGARSSTTTFARPSGSHLGTQPEVEQVKFIELFCTIYRSDVWERVWRWMLPEENNGYCIDVCSGHLAKEFDLGPTLLVPSMVAYHLVANIPAISDTESITIEGLANELKHTWDKIPAAQDDTKDHFKMCKQHGCRP